MLEPGQHRRNFPPQGRVVAACLGDKRVPVGRVALAGGME